MKAAIVTLAVGVALLLGVGAAALAQAPPRLVRVGGAGVKAVTKIGVTGIVGSTNNSPTVCQTGESLPRGVTAIRVSMWAFLGARMRVMVFQGPHLITEGSRNGAWTSDSVTVPVRPVDHATSNTRFCFAIGHNSEPLVVLGTLTPPSQAAYALPIGVHAATAPAKGQVRIHGKVAVEYLAPGRHTWWSKVLAVARHLGLGRFYSGTWIALLVALLTTSAAALAVRLTLRELQ